MTVRTVTYLTKAKWIQRANMPHESREARGGRERFVRGLTHLS